jgi:hypothetical protein
MKRFTDTFDRDQVNFPNVQAVLLHDSMKLFASLSGSKRDVRHFCKSVIVDCSEMIDRRHFAERRQRRADLPHAMVVPLPYVVRVARGRKK